ncbi:MAG: hypothetical protein K0Q73_6426, partial [Paenibacillus sp.]|nr:hypothetical protein [Paenibacillus sp.]
ERNALVQGVPIDGRDRKYGEGIREACSFQVSDNGARRFDRKGDYCRELLPTGLLPRSSNRAPRGLMATRSLDRNEDCLPVVLNDEETVSFTCNIGTAKYKPCATARKD